MARPRRQAASWNRADSLLVLASYMERPGHMAVPPRQERERVAGITGQSVEEVSRRCWMFAGLDPRNRTEGEPAGERERRLWDRYTDDRLQCMLDAEAAMDEFRRLPRHMS